MELCLRDYRPADCAALAALFYETVHTVNKKDYTPAQLAAWATGTVDLAAWNASFLAHKTVVAWSGGEIVGFGDMDERGYLDRLYVHQDFQGRKIATAVCDELERAVGGGGYSVHASITARPFFEKRGYRTVARQEVFRQGIALTNYKMEKRG